MEESRVRENCMHGLKRRGLETERQQPRQSPTLLKRRLADHVWCVIADERRSKHQPFHVT